MFVSRREVKIDWADCDPAGSVHPFVWFSIFDTATHEMFAAAGFPDTVNVPLVSAGAAFVGPAARGDLLTVESRVSEWRRSSFEVVHTVSRSDRLIVEGHETRVFVDLATMKSRPIPEEILTRFQA